MIGTILGRYRIDAKLGEGGMGVVWRAHDLQLDRDVALKVLPDALIADPESRARLLREARAAAALNHPNILTVYEVGEAGEHVYLAAEYVPGRPLSEVIGSAGLPVGEAIRLGVQIAAALAAAHERGLVHRDVKPSNVLVTPAGDAKVLDFGIATWLIAEHADTRSLDLTMPGALVGTPGSMAPELWRGARADLRSDVWSFGALLFTMLSGAPPFEGRTAFELSTAICTTDPPPLPERVPISVRAIVARCLEREPERRFRSAMEVHAALQAVATGAVHGVATSAAASVPSLGRGARVGIALAIGAALALAVAAIVLAPRWPGPGGAAHRAITSLAVLPLENFSRDADQQYFADGMTEELITRLSQLGIVRVISRTSVMRFRGSRLSLPDISRQLGVDAIVEGSVEQVGGRVRITAQLVRAANDEHLWARSYERATGDALAMQDEVAEAIAHEVRGTLAPVRGAGSPATRAVSTAARPRTSAPAAVVQAYLRGRDQYQTWSTMGVRRALWYYDQALALDSTFAPAIAAHAVALWLVSAAPETLAMARAEIARALALAPDLGEAHAARAKFLFEHDRDWAGAEREFRRAIELNPNDSEAHHHYSHLLAALGRVPEAREQARLMLALDPLAPASTDHMMWLEYECGHFAEAEAMFRRTVAVDPGYVQGYLQFADIALVQRRWAELRTTLEQARRLGAPVDPAKLQATTAAEQGRPADGIRALAGVTAPSDPYPTDWAELAAWSMVLGRKDVALAQMDSAVANRSYRILFSNLDPAFASLRSDPRYLEQRRRMRLPP